MVVSIRILWKSPFPFPFPHGPSAVCSPPVPTQNPSYIHIFSTIAPRTPTSAGIKSPACPLCHIMFSPLSDAFKSAWFFFTFSLPMELLQSLLIQSSIQALPPLPSQDNFTCSTEKMQAIVPPPPMLAIFLLILILFPPIPEEEGILPHQRPISPLAVFDLLFSRLCGLLFSVFSIPLFKPNPSPSKQLEYLNLFKSLIFWFPLSFVSSSFTSWIIITFVVSSVTSQFLKELYTIATLFPYPLFFSICNLSFHSNCFN